MNIETGEIRALTEKEIQAFAEEGAKIVEEERRKVQTYSFKTDKPKEVLITEEQRQLLEQFKPHERPQLHHDLMSRNNNAKRRARNKIAKASRQKNRR